MATRKLKYQQTSRRIARPRSLRTQREVLRDVLLAAGQCETWLTLHEMALLTGYGEASVSASPSMADSSWTSVCAEPASSCAANADRCGSTACSAACSSSVPAGAPGESWPIFLSAEVHGKTDLQNRIGWRASRKPGARKRGQQWE
jgi:hypothetical protein